MNQTMQLKLTTDYAIRCILYIAEKGTFVSNSEISEQMHISEIYIPKVLFPLKQAGLLETKQGAQGGVRLQVSPEKLTLLQIISVMEGTIRLNRCLEDDKFCSRNGLANCPVHKTYAKLQKMTEEYLSSVTIQDLLNDR